MGVGVRSVVRCNVFGYACVRHACACMHVAQYMHLTCLDYTFTSCKIDSKDTFERIRCAKHCWHCIRNVSAYCCSYIACENTLHLRFCLPIYISQQTFHSTELYTAFDIHCVSVHAFACTCVRIPLNV